MSIPVFPTTDPALSREAVINQILSSIAMEELGLSHIINAEGEKIQYALGTIDGVTGPEEPISFKDLLALNQSVRDTLDGTMQNQMLLKGKLQAALSATDKQGPTGPTGPTGPPGPPTPTPTQLSATQASLMNGYGTEREINPNAPIIFNKLKDGEGPDTFYDATTGKFTINKTGQNNLYLIQWWVFVAGIGSLPVIFDLTVGGVPYRTTSPSADRQIVGSTLAAVGNTPVEVSLINASADIVSLSNVDVQAQITIIGFHAI